jgi:hypothetical protein
VALLTEVAAALTEVAEARGGDDGDRSDGRSHGFAGLADPHLA